jgi:hypothetical protein
MAQAVAAAVTTAMARTPSRRVRCSGLIPLRIGA